MAHYRSGGQRANVRSWGSSRQEVCRRPAAPPLPHEQRQHAALEALVQVARPRAGAARSSRTKAPTAAACRGRCDTPALDRHRLGAPTSRVPGTRSTPPPAPTASSPGSSCARTPRGCPTWALGSGSVSQTDPLPGIHGTGTAGVFFGTVASPSFRAFARVLGEPEGMSPSAFYTPRELSPSWGDLLLCRPDGNLLDLPAKRS